MSAWLYMTLLFVMRWLQQNDFSRTTWDYYTEKYYQFQKENSSNITQVWLYRLKSQHHDLVVVILVPITHGWAGKYHKQLLGVFPFRTAGVGHNYTLYIQIGSTIQTRSVQLVETPKVHAVAVVLVSVFLVKTFKWYQFQQAFSMQTSIKVMPFKTLTHTVVCQRTFDGFNTMTFIVPLGSITQRNPLFFLQIWRQTRPTSYPTLFPYTPLFRYGHW